MYSLTFWTNHSAANVASSILSVPDGAWMDPTFCQCCTSGGTYKN